MQISTASNRAKSKLTWRPHLFSKWLDSKDIKCFPSLIAYILATWNSVKRIKKFLKTLKNPLMFLLPNHGLVVKKCGMGMNCIPRLNTCVAGLKVGILSSVVGVMYWCTSSLCTVLIVCTKTSTGICSNTSSKRFIASCTLVQALVLSTVVVESKYENIYQGGEWLLPQPLEIGV